MTLPKKTHLSGKYYAKDPKRKSYYENCLISIYIYHPHTKPYTTQIHRYITNLLNHHTVTNGSVADATVQCCWSGVFRFIENVVTHLASVFLCCCIYTCALYFLLWSSLPTSERARETSVCNIIREGGASGSALSFSLYICYVYYY